MSDIKNIYRITLININNPDKKRTMLLTWKKIAALSAAALAIFTILVVLLLNYTPLQTFLPNYELRKEYINNTLRVDSLISEVAIRNRYIDNLININKDSIATEIKSLPTDTAISTSTLMEKSEREKAFIKRIDESEKFNLKVLSPLSAEGILFTSPIEVGVASKTTESKNFKNGISFSTPNNAAISSVYDGNIIDISFNVNGGNNVTIQHPKGFISKYIGLTSVYAHKGDKVSAGESIGSVRGDSGKNKFTFELWHEGTPLNPQKYITF